VWSEETIPAIRRVSRHDTDAVALRFKLATMLGRLRYGDEVRIDEHVVMTCWPPTGDYDRSDAALWSSFALEMGDHRPETSYTSIERIERDLPADNSYIVREVSFPTREVVVTRKLTACPHCQGRGTIRYIERKPLVMSGPSEEVAFTQTRQCEHEPSR
jgi:hypothetical protein